MLELSLGARPLKRVIRRQIVDALALRFVRGDLGEGQTIVVDVAGDEFEFRVQEPAAAKEYVAALA